MNITLDIETIPCQDPEMIRALAQEAEADLAAELAAVKAPANYKVAETIAAYCAKAAQDLRDAHADKVKSNWLKTSFDGGLGQVVVIGFAVEGDEPIAMAVTDLSAAEEVKLLKLFFSRLSHLYNPTNTPQFIGHNLIGFDVPFLWKRCMVRNVRPPIWFPRDPKPWGDQVFDTMTQWAGARDRIKLAQLCRVLGVKGCKTDMTGADVWPAIEAGEIERVAEYCMEDVGVTRQVHARMTFADSKVSTASLKAERRTADMDY